jgi:hypothetical protein
MKRVFSFKNVGNLIIRVEFSRFRAWEWENSLHIALNQRRPLTFVYRIHVIIEIVMDLEQSIQFLQLPICHLFFVSFSFVP